MTKKKRKAAAPRKKKAKPAAKNASRGKAAAGDGRLDARRTPAANRPTVPLFDTDRFRRHIEPAYRTMWKISQRGEPPRALPADPLPPGR